MDLKLVCYYILMAIFIWAQALSAVETYDDLYIGCFRDRLDDRVLTDGKLFAGHMAIKVCINYCTGLSDIDSAYAGVEFGSQCFCGVAGTNYSRLGVAEDSDCDYRCAGDSTSYCGGANRISIYNLVLIRPPTTHAASSPFESDESTVPISTHSAKPEAVTSSSVSTYTGSTTKYNMSTGSSLGNTGSSLVPTIIYTLVPLFTIAIFVVLLVCFLRRRKRLKHGSSQGITVSERAVESPGMRHNPTFESSNVHDLLMAEVMGRHGGIDPYMALTTPRDGPTFQVYEPLQEVNSQGDVYEVPVNLANGQTGPEYGKTLHKLQEHPETEYENAHEYQDMTNSVIGRNNSLGNESPIRGLRETDYEAIHDYENPGIIG